jgi:ABC-2 type transport system permease protein
MSRPAHPYIAETGAEMLKLVRAPEFILPTLVLPTVFYTLFGVVMPTGEGVSAYLLATFGVFAVMGPALFGFGAGVAQERERGWLKLTRAVPAPAAGFMLAKTLATVTMAGLALALVYAVAAFAGDVSLPPQTWALMLGVHLLTAVPFLLAGLAIGFTFATNGAVALANLLFLAFAVLGGLWIPVQVFPGFMQNAAWWLPSFHLAELALAASGAPGERPVPLHLGMVGAMITGFALLAAFAWVRQR